MCPAPGTQNYQRESGRTRAGIETAARLFAALPPIFTFTVDLEEDPRGACGRAAPMTHRLLDLLDAAEATGTFFVLDDFARAEPALVREVARRGHEIGSHGTRHRPLAEETPAAFRAALAAARKRLEDLAGAAVQGFRAPFFSLTPQAAWAPEALAACGFAYSSSVVPAWNPLCGWPGAPERPFLWPAGVLELPCPVAPIAGLRLPFLGGMYLRYLPPWRLRQLARRWAATGGDALWSYCHPYDLDAEAPLVTPQGLGGVSGLLLWLNRGPMARRLAGLLDGRPSVSFARRLPGLAAMATTWTPTRRGSAPPGPPRWGAE